MFRKLRSLFVLWLLLVLTLPTWALEVHFVDVGQGDAIVVCTDVGAVLLMDGGETGPGRNVLVPYLRQLGVTKIDLVVATHPHYDHIGGLVPVLEEFPVDRVVACGQIHTSSTYIRFLELIDEKNIPFRTPRQGDRLSLAGVDELVVLSPPAEMFGTDLNENSLVLQLRFGDISFLFTGDIGHVAELALVGSNFLTPVTVLKVGHHGSRYSSHGDFLAVVLPEIAVIQCGQDNSYGHPHGEAISRLNAVEAKIYRTDTHGHIVVTTDGTSYGITVQKGSVPGLIDLNTATREQLMSLPGIGATLAQRIIEYREQHPFTNKEELTQVRGIGAGIYERVKDLVTVGGE